MDNRAVQRSRRDDFPTVDNHNTILKLRPRLFTAAAEAMHHRCMF